MIVSLQQRYETEHLTSLLVLLNLCNEKKENRCKARLCQSSYQVSPRQPQRLSGLIIKIASIYCNILFDHLTSVGTSLAWGTCKIIRIYHEFVDRIDNSVLRVTACCC